MTATGQGDQTSDQETRSPAAEREASETGGAALTASIVEDLATVSASEWNVLDLGGDPFLSHEFLLALEDTNSVGEAHGWYPRHLTLRSGNGRLVGASPMYLKNNSWGEFVFDWTWADAYHRHGLDYYPKLVAGVPYTPVTGARLLVATDTDRSRVRGELIRQGMRYAARSELSGVHWLFVRPDESELLAETGLIRRTGLQYHWHNPGYADFDDFLASLTSRRRKTIRRERRFVNEQGLTLQVRHGSELDSREWSMVYRFYASIYDRKHGYPSLTEAFFQRIGRTMGDRVVLVLALDPDRRPVACAINFRGGDALYGRFWGCTAQYHSLHFEACYYQGVEYCIRHGLRRFEPGAQGEHKIPRGFLPTATWSGHWIADPRFRAVLKRYCDQERELMVEEYRELMARSPYRQATIPAG